MEGKKEKEKEKKGLRLLWRLGLKALPIVAWRFRKLSPAVS
jgi:hypothetical protein